MMWHESVGGPKAFLLGRGGRFSHCHFASVAFLMDGVPVFVDLTGFKLYGFVAVGADGKLRLGHDIFWGKMWHGADASRRSE